MEQIIKRPLSDLKEAAQNSRKHSDHQIDQIATSIQRFGWTIPVVIDEAGVIIAGHARVRAAKQIGLTEAPCLVATGWSDSMKEAYQITDNRLSEMSEWDTDILGDQIKRLNAEQFDLSFLDMTGFDLELFKPTLAPMTKIGEVTADQVQKAKSGLEGKFDTIKANAAPKHEVTCPHCGESFTVTI